MKIIRYETYFKKQLYFNQTELKAKRFPKRFESQLINLYPEITYQSMLGFGGAITESAGFAFSKLSTDKQDSLINDYFSKDGLNYSLARLPIGSCDFSIKSYSYASKRNLSDFSIEKDKQYIIPFLKKAIEKKPNLECLSSPWSPPWFMKNTFFLVLGGKLRSKYKQKWADYFVKYINAYKDEGINIKYLTVQNEPNAIQIWESCIYNSKDEADFAINYLYPSLKSNNIDAKILIWDHNKDRVLKRAIAEFSIEGSTDAIAGMAFHYYSGDHFQNLKLFKDMYPDKLLIHTEMCTGYSGFKQCDEIPNAELYAHEIIGDLNSGTNGFFDWNIMLDHEGGPNHKKNFCNSPVMLTDDLSDYIKNLSFSYIGHFSKYIQVGAKRIAYSSYTDKLEITSFKNPDNTIAVVIMNKYDWNIDYNLWIEDKLIHDTIECHSIITLIIK